VWYGIDPKVYRQTNGITETFS
jgi:hypothetical protein